tara:strand:+ start:1268 stop:2551 length:1284 start_codon:yes stop_codon:yes gene_type:complete
MKGVVITMATLWVDLSDGKTQISGTKPTPSSVPVHEISVKDKKQTLVYRSTIPDFYSKIVRVLMAKQIQKAKVSIMQNFPDLLVLYFHKDRDRDRIAQMAMTCSYFNISIKPNILAIEYDIGATPVNIDQAVDIKKYDIEDLNKGSAKMSGGGGGGKRGPPGPAPPAPGPPPKPKPDPKKFNEDNPPLEPGDEKGEGKGECAGGECSGGDPLKGKGSGEGGKGSGGDSGEGAGKGGDGEGEGEGEGAGGDGDGDGDSSEDGKPSPCEECSQEAKDQNASLDPAIDFPKDAMEKAKAATDAALEAEAKAEPDSESDKKAVDEAKEAAKEAIDKAREVNDHETLSEEESAENNEALDDMEDSLTSDFEKLAEEIQDELDEAGDEDGEIGNESSMELVRKLIKLKSLATPHDREEVDRIENEIKIKIDGE